MTAGENPEVVQADFASHRMDIATQSSPFGPVLSGEVTIATPESHEESNVPRFTFLRKASGGLIRVYFGTDDEVAELNAPIKNGALRD